MGKAPNIVFFMTDHQRVDTVGMVQCGREVTPNLNKLAGNGFQFNRAYDACPLCVPARTALATGIYPTRNHVVYNDWEGIHAKSYETIHSMLKKAGYCVGHIGVDHIKVKPPMREQGLDFFIDQNDYTLWASQQGVQVDRSQDELTLVSEEIDGEHQEKRYSSHKVSVWRYPKEQFKDFYFLNQALTFLRHSPKEPFALFLYLWAPHPPLRVPEPYASMYDPEKINLPPNIGMPSELEPTNRRNGVPAQLANGVSVEEWKKVWAAHLGLVTMADDILGEILSELERSGIASNTSVLFTADHGDSLGQHGMYQKMEMYEEAINVPLVIYMPGIKPGKSNGVVSHLDIMPTICQIAGISCNTQDGISLIPILDGEKVNRDRVVFSQYSGNPGYGTVRRAAITERFKYVFDSNFEHELYDLKTDIWEMKNVAKEEKYEAVVREMYQLCRMYHEEHDDYFNWKLE